MRPQLPITHNFAFLQHTPSKSLRVEIIHTTNLRTAHHQPTHRSPIVVHVTETPCYASLAYFSYALLICRHSPRWRTSRRRWASGLILLADLHLAGVAYLPSLSSLANISYALLVCCHSLCWPTFRTRCASGLILLAGLHLVRVAPLASFSSLTYIS